MLIGLGSAADETRGKAALIRGLVAANGCQGDVGQVLLLVGLRPVTNPGRRLSVLVRNDTSETTRHEFSDLTIGRHAESPCLVDRLRRALFLGHAADGCRLMP